MRLFDLHCDTLGEMFRRGEGIYNNSLHISLDKALGVFEQYNQVMAIWSENDISDDENYIRCLSTLDYAEKNIYGIEGFTPILAVEGGKLLNYDISRLDVLAKRGVKIFTPVWKGKSCMGGAYDNEDGLSGFGFSVINRCFELGITPDLSHSNDKICSEIIELSYDYEKPVIASHSCVRSVYPHPRNISDETAKKVAENGGVVGVNFVSEHLGGKSTEIILSHIDALRNLCGEKGVCLGGDLDGMSDSCLPDCIKNVGDVAVLYDAISKKYHSEDFSDALFYSNARNFAKDYLF